MSVREGKRGSRGVWLPSLPSPEETLENRDNKNSCSPAKRKCHFYPGLVLGTTGATSPMGSEAEGQLRPGGRTGEHSMDPETKERAKDETSTEASAQKSAMGDGERDPFGSSWGQGGTDRGTWLLSTGLRSPLTQGLPGNVAKPALPAQSRYRRAWGPGAGRQGQS